MQAQAPIPILRSFDEAKAREFYVDFLGFEVVFAHNIFRFVLLTSPLRPICRCT